MALILSLARRILSIAANYIDEAVMSYVVAHEGQNVWQTASDGVVLYAQSWKKLLGTATVFVLFVSVVWIVVFLAVFIPLLPVAKTLGQGHEGMPAMLSLGALVIAYLVANIGKWILIDPMATVAMIVSFNRAIRDETPAYDLKEKLIAVSGKYRQIVQNAGKNSSPPPEPVPG
jgi:hypothetical protein